MSIGQKSKTVLGPILLNLIKSNDDASDLLPLRGSPQKKEKEKEKLHKQIKYYIEYLKIYNLPLSLYYI